MHKNHLQCTEAIELLEIKNILSLEDWTQRKKNHEQRTDALLSEYLDNRSRHHKQPVLDFLFEYYHFRPSKLRNWSPGLGKTLALDSSLQSFAVKNSANEASYPHLPSLSELCLNQDIAYLDPKYFPEKRLSSLEWVIKLLHDTQSQKSQFGCFGLHEWAMVYRSEVPRHNQVPLRFSQEKIAEIVDSHHLLCTHFDAFRFFTPSAQPLNKNSLSREAFAKYEQPGCIHTNMDVYKWAYKFYPWISSELILDAFKLAYQARYIDMRASPYDLGYLGLKPIKIETEKGKKEYRVAQETLSVKAKKIRSHLIVELELLWDILSPSRCS
tara:strand:- start:3532 stop:4509 length:978 start_codon:yes stop_codon:yes gene_type:complete